MPFTSAVMMARPPAGLPPQVQVITLLTDSSFARSPTEAVNADSTSPVTDSCHPSGLSATRGTVAPQMACDTRWKNVLITSLDVSVVWSYANVPSTSAGMTCELSTAVPCAGASVPPAAAAPSAAGSPANATTGVAAMDATIVNPARAESVARPYCVVVFIIVPPTLP